MTHSETMSKMTKYACTDGNINFTNMHSAAAAQFACMEPLRIPVLVYFSRGGRRIDSFAYALSVHNGERHQSVHQNAKCTKLTDMLDGQ